MHKRAIIILLAGLCLGAASVAEAVNSVTVTSKSVAKGAAGVTIPILLVNDVSLRALTVPLALREATPGCYITSLTMSYGDRLPEGPGQPISDISFKNQYADEDGTCKAGSPGGFGTITYTNGGPNPVVSSPEGAMFARQSIFASPELPPGSDASGSLILTVDVTSIDGTFEIDSTCANPQNHLRFFDAAMNPILPVFTKGIITVGTPPTNDPPVAICQNVGVYADANCEAAVSASAVDDGSNDPDGDPITRRLNPLGPYALGVNSVWLVVEDDQGEADSCQATITVEDATPPVVTCPDDITARVYQGQSGTTVAFSATATDNCGPPAVNCFPPSGSFFPVGTTVDSCIATDGAGNTDTCSFTITVEIDYPPVAVCQDVNVDADAGCQASVTASQVDNGSYDPEGDPFTLTLVPPGPFALGATPVMLIAESGSNDTDTCEATVTVADNSPPTADCPDNISIDVRAPATGATVNFTATATDNCPGVTIACVPSSGSFFDEGTTQVRCIAIDGSGNADTCYFAVTITVLSGPGTNAVVVTSKSVGIGATGVIIPIKINNDVALNTITVPLIIREVTAGSYITSMALSYGDRLPEGMGQPLGDIVMKYQYPTENGNCKDFAPGGFSIQGPADFVSPDGALFARAKIIAPALAAGSDATGSLILTVDVTTTPGTFEIDSTCADPNNHLMFSTDPAGAPLVPDFVKGIITIGSCVCPHQCDYDEDSFLTAIDLGALIDVLFAGRPEETDPGCPTSRGDFNNDGFPDALDLSGLIDHLFAGQPGPCDPCNPVQSTCVP